MQCVYSSMPRFMRVLVWCLGLALFVLLLMYVSGQADFSFKSRFSKQDHYEVSDTTHNDHNNYYPDSNQDLDNHQPTSRGTSSLSGAPSPQNKSRGSMGRPNIIFAMADDLGWGDVEYNNGNVRTPNLNKMVQSPNAILLQRHYSGGPVCSPTRGTVLTGRNHNRYCLWDANAGYQPIDQVTPETMPLPPSEITVAEVLKEAGYSTALYGKWHLGDFQPLKGGNTKWPVSHPGLHGFDRWEATARSGPTITFNCACFDVKCPRGRQSCKNYYTIRSDNLEGWPELIAGDDSHFIWSFAEKYIREQVEAKKPFFLYLPFHAPHFPFVATQQYKEMYHKLNFSVYQADYYGAISAMDEVIGKVRELLEELGIKKNTLFWFTSDNGPEVKTPGMTNGLRGMKRQLYEGGIRVPGVIEWPSVITSNKVSSFAVVTSDLLPTVYDILGIEPKDNRPIDGISVLPLLQGKVEKRGQLIYWAYNIHGHLDGGYRVATSGDQYKLICTYQHGKFVKCELYDLVTDIGETKDLSESKPAITSEMMSHSQEWIKSVMDSTKSVGCLGTAGAL